MQRAIHRKDAMHRDVAASLDQLGNVLEAQGDIDEAEACFREALNMMCSMFGQDSKRDDIETMRQSLERVENKRRAASTDNGAALREKD